VWCVMPASWWSALLIWSSFCRWKCSRPFLRAMVLKGILAVPGRRRHLCAGPLRKAGRSGTDQGNLVLIKAGAGIEDPASLEGQINNLPRGGWRTPVQCKQSPTRCWWGEISVRPARGCGNLAKREASQPHDSHGCCQPSLPRQGDHGGARGLASAARLKSDSRLGLAAETVSTLSGLAKGAVCGGWQVGWASR